MARFTETDEAAQLLQQILTMSTSATACPTQPSDIPTYQQEDATNGDAQYETASPVATPTLPFSSKPLASSLPPPPAFPGTVIREVVTTQAGQAQPTLRTPPQETPGDVAGLGGETVADFFRRVVRPLPNADFSTT
ncbi:MAG: hypothetical protein ACUVR8_08395 [Acidobacteriota bacterium]